MSTNDIALPTSGIERANHADLSTIKPPPAATALPLAVKVDTIQPRTWQPRPLNFVSDMWQERAAARIAARGSMLSEDQRRLVDAWVNKCELSALQKNAV